MALLRRSEADADNVSRRNGFRDLGGLVLGGVAAGAVHAAIYLTLRESNTSWCSDGLEGLGCAIFSILFIAVAAAIIGGVANWMAMRFTKTAIAGPTAFLSTLAFVVWWFALDDFIAGSNFAVLPMVAPPVVLNVLVGGLFRVVRPSRGAVALAAVGVFVAAVPVYAVSSQIGSHRYRSNRDELVASANFVVYEFGWMPPGYEARDLQFSGFGNRPYAELSALHGTNDITKGDPPPFTVVSFRRPAYFDPPNNCGSDRPYTEDPREPCTPAGATARGEPVWVDNGAAYSNRQVFYVVRGDTLVTLGTTSYERDMSRADVLRILDGLRPYRPST